MKLNPISILVGWFIPSSASKESDSLDERINATVKIKEGAELSNTPTASLKIKPQAESSACRTLIVPIFNAAQEVGIFDSETESTAELSRNDSPISSKTRSFEGLGYSPTQQTLMESWDTLFDADAMLRKEAGSVKREDAIQLIGELYRYQQQCEANYPYWSHEEQGHYLGGDPSLQQSLGKMIDDLHRKHVVTSEGRSSQIQY